MWLLLLIVLVILFILIIKPYFIRYDTIVFFGGGPGSGKTYMSSTFLRILLRKNRIKVSVSNFLICIKNLFRKKTKKIPLLPKPMPYSNMPVWVSPKESAIELRDGHLLLQRRIIPRSVILLDELDSFANQFEFGQINLIKQGIKYKKGDTPIDWDKFGAAFDEFVRFIRHYTQGGYLICNTQCSANALLQIRRRINTVFDLFDIKFWGIPFGPKFISSVKVRNITISEEVRTVETNNKEDNMRLLLTIVPWYKMYDTYCYRNRYLTVPYRTETRWQSYTTNHQLRCPEELQRKYTTSINPGEEILIDFDAQGVAYDYEAELVPFDDDDPDLFE